MMKREDYLVWLLIFSTNLMAGAQSTGSFDVQVKAVKSNHSCVDVSWEGADSVQYTVSCNGTRIDQTSSPQRVCRNYQPYSLVQCSVTATQAGASGTGSGRTACGKPSEPTFTLSNGTMYYEDELRRRIIVNNLKVEKINCGSISEVTARVYRISDEKFIDLAGSVGLDESYKINNLDAVTQYRVVVEVINDGVDNNNNFVTAEQYKTTGELPPGPVGDLTSSSSSPKCVDLTWLAPAEPRGTITLYTVNCTGDVRETTTALQISICRFSGYQMVNCSVGAKNEFYGTPTLTSTRTKCDPPSLPQFQLSQNLSADGKRREISVNQIKATSNCESLQQIIIRLYKGSEEINSHDPSDLTRPSATFSDLDAVTDYTVKVIAVNNEGRRSENSSSISTGESTPGGPPDGFKLNLNSSCVTLDWSEPLKPNGIILNYMVSCLDQKITLPAKKDENSARYTFCRLSSATQVNCSVSANNSIGWSAAAMSSGYTAPKPMEAPQPAEITPKYEVLEAKIKTVSFTNETLKVQHYQFVVESVGSTTRKKRDASAVDVNQLFNEQTATSKGLNYYVAGRISDQTGEMIEFTTGDNEKYGNKDLERGVQYKIHYTYTVKLGDQDETYLVESPTSYELGPFPAHLIVIIIIVILIAIIVTVLVVLYKKNVISFKWIKTQGKTGEEINEDASISLTTPENSSQEKDAPVAAEESSVPMWEASGDEDRRENEFEEDYLFLYGEV